jgi:hypothetical protein
LLAFYHDHPAALRTKWIVNVNGETLQSLTFADRDRYLGVAAPSEDRRPLLDWDDPRDAITVESLERLVAEQRLLHPNRKTPWEHAHELIDPEDPDRVDQEKLATRRPPKDGLKRGEIVLNSKATEELLPWFIATQLPFGIAGLVVAGFLAATMSAMQAGLNSVSTVAILDLSWPLPFTPGRQRSGTNPRDVNEADQPRHARNVTLGLGLVLTLLATFLGTCPEVIDPLLEIATGLGVPLLGVFLLGVFTRRCTAAGAILGLVCGTLLTQGFRAAKVLAHGWLGPLEPTFEDSWSLTFGLLATCGVGYAASFFVGVPRNSKELRGLVLGCGQLGVRK